MAAAVFSAIMFVKIIIKIGKEVAMEFFTEMTEVLSIIVIGIGAALAVWGGINLLEGYGNDNPGSKSQGIKQLVAGIGVGLIGFTIIPMLPGLFG